MTGARLLLINKSQMTQVYIYKEASGWRGDANIRLERNHAGRASAQSASFALHSTGASSCGQCPATTGA